MNYINNKKKNNENNKNKSKKFGYTNVYYKELLAYLT